MRACSDAQSVAQSVTSYWLAGAKCRGGEDGGDNVAVFIVPGTVARLPVWSKGSTEPGGELPSHWAWSNRRPDKEGLNVGGCRASGRSIAGHLADPKLKDQDCDIIKLFRISLVLADSGKDLAAE